MAALSPMTPIDPRVEMFQRSQSRNQDAFFNMKALASRPVSAATEMFDTDFEDDESVVDESPRLSLNSAGRRSETTLSSFEEISTPVQGNDFQGFNFELPAPSRKSVEGPVGPHLFRSSVDSSLSAPEDQYVLSMSPMTPRPSALPHAAWDVDAPQLPRIPPKHAYEQTYRLDPTPRPPFRRPAEPIDEGDVSQWSPRMVARWMANAGIEQSIVEKFEENDISGAILITLKFEDLRELDIPSFGQRTKVWNEIHILRGSPPSTPKPATPIDETASLMTELRRPREHSRRRGESRDKSQDCASEDEHRGARDSSPRRRRKGSRRRHRSRKRSPEDVISPLESVSIVGIEQLMPKPHKCAKGENCSKWRKQQRLIDNFKQEHPIEQGTIWIAGNPGNPLTADPIVVTPVTAHVTVTPTDALYDPSRPFSEANRPMSDAVPSIVASSDVLGPSLAPSFRYLEEATLRVFESHTESRDPQDNVKQFLQFQHIDSQPMAWSSEEPSTPPYEMFPALNPPHAGLRGLPKLAIPPPRPPPRAASANAFQPYQMDRAEALSPELRNATTSPNSVYRFGTPFSEMDVPVTAINLGPVPRDASQSVPPNMSYRHAAGPPVSMQPLQTVQRTLSRSSRRPSALPAVFENTVTTAPVSQTQFDRGQTQPLSGSAHHAPSQSWSPIQAPAERSADDISYAGWMKKRKTKMLRHEWHDHHFTLKGTRLAMHKDERTMDMLEYIDVDDYAIACSSLAGNSKLNAAFKAMNISRGAKDKKDDVAFSFQLIPASLEKGTRLTKKRESAVPQAPAPGASLTSVSALSLAQAQAHVNAVMADGKDVAAAKNKTHHFAVKSREERIDWMRELMLAKALKQKSEGFEVNLNGSAI